MQVIYKYFAIKPIQAEHPVGSGIVVEYGPGDEVPAGEWGRAADNLVELGKIARVAFNVPDEGDLELAVGNKEIVVDPDEALHVTETPRRGRPPKK